MIAKDKKEFEELINKLKDLFWIVDDITDGTWTWNLITDEVYYSPEWKKNFGYKESEIENTIIAWENIVHSEDLEYLLDTHFKYLKKEIPRFEVKYRIKTKSGEYKWILGRGKAIWNDKGKPIYMVGTHTDITKHMKDKEELRESEERYKKLIDLSPDAVFVHSNFKIIFANNSAAKLLGLRNPKEIIGRSIWEFVHPEFTETVKKRIYTSEINNEASPLIQEKLIRLDGAIIDVGIATNSIPYNGKKATLSIARDITKHKQREKRLKHMMEKNEELLKKTIEYDKMKTEFFSNISHELKTPLNIILSSVQLVKSITCKKEPCDYQTKVNRYLTMIRQNCYRLLRLINNLIDVTKIDSGFLKMSLKNYDIVRIVEDITLSISEYTRSKNINLVFDTEIEEKIIACDVDNIERVMLNLLSNAVKFSDSHSTITVKIFDKGEWIMISVKDEGQGMPKDKLKNIFERFSQVNSSLNRLHGGSGIGLSLVKSIIESHNGKITVRSEYGVGSEFIIKIPIRLVDEDKNIRTKEDIGIDNKVEKINIEFSDIYSS